MIDGVVLALLIAIALHDGFADVVREPPFAPGMTASLWIGAHVALTLALLATTSLCARQLDRTGRFRWARRAELSVRLTRLGIVAVHVIAIYYLGVLQLVRETLGNPVLLDEAFVITPPVIVLLVTHATWYPVERRLREATLIRHLDEGEPVASIPTRVGYLVDQFRHRILTVLVPVTIIAGWSESIDRLAQMQAWSEGLTASLQYAGALLAIIIMPALVRNIWATRRLAPGPLRSRLDEMCREQRVACRDLLVWRTHGGMINGALIGLLAPLRYVLLTDGLLDRLPTHQVEAVMAHELAHARKNHLPWLLASVLAVSMLAWSALGILVASALDTQDEAFIAILAMPPTIIISVAWFGYVSRRFEWQADACAVQHLAGWHAQAQRRGASPLQIDLGSVEAMAGALGSVARLNNVHHRRNSFRHGSISSRQRRLRELVGLDANRMPIDGTVRQIKLATLIGLIMLAMWIASGFIGTM